MQCRLIITRYGFCLDRDVMDRELRFQHVCNGTPHSLRIFSFTNRKVGGIT